MYSLLDPLTRPRHIHYYATDYKLALWATLVFFVYGSSLQSSAGLLLCSARLVLHSHFEPYRDPVDNLFDYLCLAITSLVGLGGLVLNSLEHEKNLAVIKSDKEWTRSAEGDINVVSEALNVLIIVVLVVFVVFGMHHLVATQPKVQALLRKCQYITRLRCPCLQHLWARRRTRQRRQ